MSFVLQLTIPEKQNKVKKMLAELDRKINLVSGYNPAHPMFAHRQEHTGKQQEEWRAKHKGLSELLRLYDEAYEAIALLLQLSEIQKLCTTQEQSECDKHITALKERQKARNQAIADLERQYSIA
jgi:hypothetical protein